MIEHAVEIRIERPAEDVFAFVTDAANHPRWNGSSVTGPARLAEKVIARSFKKASDGNFQRVKQLLETG